MSYYYKAEEIKNMISEGGRWLDILGHFGSDLEDALRRPGRHVSCPVHGGKHRDAFRLFKDAHVTGGGICNSCGPRHDGFELLMWLRGWSFAECTIQIGDYLGARRYEKRTEAPSGEFVPKQLSSTAQSSGSEQKVREFRGKGKIVAFGQARYKFEKKASPSYYVTLANKEGKEREVWGVDLERAMTESNAGQGDLVSLYYLGRNSVTVVQPVLDEHGDVVAENTILTHRNEWEVSIGKKAYRPVTDVEVVDVVEMPEQAPTRINKSNDRSNVAIRSVTTQAISDEAIPAPEIPVWIEEAKARMEKLAANRAKYGKRAASKIQSLWEECLSLSSPAASVARLYFESRGFVAVFSAIAAEDELRFHPALDYYDEDEDGNAVLVGKFPAIVGAIRDVDRNILTLHRTYLSKTGKKAKVSSPKKMMAIPDDVDINGGSIQLGEPINGVLGCAEGFETAASAYRATGISTWSTINAQLMKTFEVPEDVHTIIAWVDLDKTCTGEIAATILKERMQPKGVKVILAIPPCKIPKNAKGVDWNDVLLEKGLLGFPNPIRLQKFVGIDVAPTQSPLRKAFR